MQSYNVSFQNSYTRAAARFPTTRHLFSFTRRKNILKCPAVSSSLTFLSDKTKSVWKQLVTIRFSLQKNHTKHVLLFVPLGFFLPLFWKKFSSFWYAALFGFCTSLLIELLQIFTFRATDINDLMTNTVGTVLGYLLARVVLKLLPGTEPSARTKDVFLVCGMTFGVMFFVQPFLAALVWNWIM